LYTRGGPRKTELLSEIQSRLELTECHVAQLHTRWRALPPDHPERTRLLQEIEISAAICSELQDLEALISGRTDTTSQITSSALLT
jgi:hypothetical protein